MSDDGAARSRAAARATLDQGEVARVLALVCDAVEDGRGARSRRGGEYDLAGLQRVVTAAWAAVAAGRDNE